MNPGTEANQSADVPAMMVRALDLARAARASGNPGVASLIVKNGHVLGEGTNREGDTGNPLIHAEMEALRHAIERFGRSEIAGSTCVTTVEPCPMCAGALLISGVSEVVAGARHADVHPGRFGLFRFEDLASMMGMPVRFSAGTLKDECVACRRV